MIHPLSESAARDGQSKLGVAQTMNEKKTTLVRRRGPWPGSVLRTLGMAMLSTAFLAACATTPGGGSGGGAVVDRANARWQALVTGDFPTAYSYYSPGYRSSKTVGDFELSMRLRKVQFRGAEYADHECEGESCVLKFNVQYSIASPVPGLTKWESKTILEERWIRTQGEWWYLPDD